MLDVSVVTLLVLLLPVTNGFNMLASKRASSVSTPIPCDTASEKLPEKYTFAVQTTDTGLLMGLDVADWPTWTTGSNDRWTSHMTQKDSQMPDGELNRKVTQVSRRNLLRGASWATGMYYGSGTIACASAYTVSEVEPDEIETYAEAQKGKGPLRVLWIGSGDMKGVFQNLFPFGNEVIAMDLRRPEAGDLSAATTYATEHGYQLRFEQGDATDLKYSSGTFDVVVCSMFLCQDFNPEVVVSEIRRVLKPGGRFGFYEHVEDIDKIIVDKVFGERSVIRVQHAPKIVNVMAGVVRKV